MRSGKDINKTTRVHDFETLEELDPQSERQQMRKQVQLEMIYEQIQDPYLEKLRNELIHVVIHLQEEGQNLELLKQFRDIQNKVQTYCSTPAFRKRMATVVAKISESEAMKIYRGVIS